MKENVIVTSNISQILLLVVFLNICILGLILLFCYVPLSLFEATVPVTRASDQSSQVLVDILGPAVEQQYQKKSRSVVAPASNQQSHWFSYTFVQSVIFVILNSNNFHDVSNDLGSNDIRTCWIPPTSNASTTNVSVLWRHTNENWTQFGFFDEKVQHSEYSDLLSPRSKRLILYQRDHQLSNAVA